MYYNQSEIFSSVKDISEKLFDEESRYLYNLRLKFLIDRDRIKYAEDVLKLNKKWRIIKLENQFDQNKNLKQIVLWGCGQDGKYTRALLAHTKFSDYPITFVSNTPSEWGTEISVDVSGQNILTSVISPLELAADNKDAVIVISSRRYWADILRDIMTLGIDQTRVICDMRYILLAIAGNQYFDFFQPIDDSEIFLDAGVLNGDTSLDFVKWCNNNYQGIYAFEPNPKVYETCRRCFSDNGLSNTVIFPYAVWNTDAMLDFSANITNSFSAAHVIETPVKNGRRSIYDREEIGKERVHAKRIDDCLKGEKVTFIKMDIQGSEFKALMGAEQTIRKYKPRMAISIYHKPEDILEIPYIIHQFNPDYQFAIRQYCLPYIETVLYAF